MKINENHILVNTQSEAIAILDRITAGEDLTVIGIIEPLVADLNSKIETLYAAADRNVDLEITEFEDSVFRAYNTPMGEASPIMFSSLGYHIIKRTR